MTEQHEIDEILGDIVGIEGVTGVIASDNRGGIIAARMPAMYEPETIEAVAKRVVDSLLNIREYGSGADDVIFHFENIRVVIKNIRKGFLIIMSMPDMSVPLLNISTNAFRKRIIRLLTFSRKTPAKPKSPGTETGVAMATNGNLSETTPVATVADHAASLHLVTNQTA